MKKIKKKFFIFEIVASEYCCVKLSQVRREYLPSALSLLGDSFEILHVTKRAFLQVNCLHSDQ